MKRAELVPEYFSPLAPLASATIEDPPPAEISVSSSLLSGSLKSGDVKNGGPDYDDEDDDDDDDDDVDEATREVMDESGDGDDDQMLLDQMSQLKKNAGEHTVPTG